MLLATLAHMAVGAVLLAAVVAVFFVAPIASVLLAVPCLYLAVFVAVLVDATIVVAVHDAALGEPISLHRSFVVAWSHRGALAAWAFDLLTVGLAIRIAAALLGRVGELLGLAAEMAWATVALLVVPAIVIGDVPMPAAFDTSRESLRSTLGQRVLGLIGISLVGFVLMVPFVALLLVAALIDSGPLIVAGLIASAVGWAIAMFVVDAASAVLGYAIYAHLEHAPLPASFCDTALGTTPSPAPAAP